MKRDDKLKCSRCNKEKTRREIIRINSQWVCKDCQREAKQNKRKKHLDELREKGVIRKKRSPQEMMEYREEQKAQKLITQEKQKNFKPIIRGSKKQTQRKFSIGLTFEEKKILFGLLIKRGLPVDEVKERIKAISDNTKKIREKIKSETEDAKEINRKFKESFAKIVEGER